MLTDDVKTFARMAWGWVNSAWSWSLLLILGLWLGSWIGEVRTEMRIVADCKYASVFRVDIQAYTCQRKL